MLSVFNRPKQLVERRDGEEITVESKMNEVVYLYKCTRCTITLQDRAAKVVMDSCEDVQVQIVGGLVTGLTEILKCQRAKLAMKAEVTIPTCTIESSQDIDIELENSASQLNTIYLLNANNIRVICPSEVHPLALPDGTNPSQQCVASRTGASFAVERVVREGIGYPTTAAKKAEAEKRTELLKKKIAEIAEESIRISACAPNRMAGSDHESDVDRTGTEAEAEETTSDPSGHPTDGVSKKGQSRDSHE